MKTLKIIAKIVFFCVALLILRYIHHSWFDIGIRTNAQAGLDGVFFVAIAFATSKLIEMFD